MQSSLPAIPLNTNTATLPGAYSCSGAVSGAEQGSSTSISDPTLHRCMKCRLGQQRSRTRHNDKPDIRKPAWAKVDHDSGAEFLVLTCAVQGASTTTSDPYMALVDEMIDKGSEFSLRGTDDELDMRSAVEASLGYEDLGAAEQDMRIRYMITALRPLQWPALQAMLGAA